MYIKKAVVAFLFWTVLAYHAILLLQRAQRVMMGKKLIAILGITGTQVRRGDYYLILHYYQ